MSSTRSGWSFDIGTIASVRVRMHVTLLALLVWLGFSSGKLNPINDTFFILSILVSLLGHEAAHILAARLAGVPARDTTLYPFGGITTYLAKPGPGVNLVIALAGPLFNLAVILALLPFIDLSSIPVSKVSSEHQPLEGIFAVNIFILLLNLLPALPMDGGHALRSALAFFKVKSAHVVTVRVSQAFCLLLAIGSVTFSQPFFLLLAFFVFFGAIQEYVRSEGRSTAALFTVADAMIPRERLEIFTHGTTISKALTTSLTSLQPLFPVMMGQAAVGVVFRDDLVQHAATLPDEYVSAIMIRSLPVIAPATPLAEVFTLLEESGGTVVIVQQEDAFMGLILEDRLMEFLLLATLRRSEREDNDIDWPTAI